MVAIPIPTTDNNSPKEAETRSVATACILLHKDNEQSNAVATPPCGHACDMHTGPIPKQQQC